MFEPGHTFEAFRDLDLQGWFVERIQHVCAVIEAEKEDYILKVNETEYLNHLVEKYALHTPEIDFEGNFIEHYEKDIPAERFPRVSFDVDPEKKYARPVILYCFPYTGDVEVLKWKPTPGLVFALKLEVRDDCLCFEVVSFGEDLAEAHKKAAETISSLKTQLQYLARNLDGHNTSMRTITEQTFQSRKQRILDRHKQVAALNIPIRRREESPGTYTVPMPTKRKKIITKPTVAQAGFEPEPTIDESTYREILSDIHKLLKEFERLPSVYEGKDEEGLRDLILLMLALSYEGSATGETFNKGGKTDILIRHLNSSLFVAECKIWHGQANYLKGIRQLLKYLTWRDSKAAVIVFVKNKEVSQVLEKVEETTPQHENCLGFLKKVADAWLDYRFHINGDPNREVKLAVLLCHIPPV